jgi:sulfoxide reductase heme-binding subunit YedZ
MALWFATRAFGLVTLTLFSAVVVLGLLTAGRRAGRGAPLRQAFVVAGLHRSLSLLALAFLGLHIAANVLDDYVTIRWTDAVVPFVSDYHPYWLGLGAIACDIVLVLIITSLLRVRMGLRAWRAVHWLAYACWPIAVVHAIGVGTDRGLAIALAVACALAVAIAVAVRLTALPRTDPAPRPTETRSAAAGRAGERAGERVAGRPGPHLSPGAGTMRGSR